jgi:hypothetical protein
MIKKSELIFPLLLIIFIILFFIFYYFKNKEYKNNIILKLNQNKDIKNDKPEKVIKVDKPEKDIKTLNTEHSYYKSNKHDTYDMLNRDLILLETNNIIENENVKNENVKNNVIENMENMNDLFPDLNKNAFSLNPKQSPKDLLLQEEYERDNTKMSDELLNMDTRPNEQKDLDNLLDDLNVYLYLLKKSILNDLNNKRDININQKISLYYNLFKDTEKMAIEANEIYIENKLTPNYTADITLDKNVAIFLTNKNSLSQNMTIIYSNILKKNNVDKYKLNLINLTIPTPSTLDAEEESDEIDPLTILRECADNIDSFYDSLNTVIVPYYNFIFELDIAPYPRDDDKQDPNSPDNKSGAALTSSFMGEMISFSSTYNSIMINYIMNEDLYDKIIIPRDYKNNLLKLPNLSESSSENIKQLLDKNIISVSQILSFDKSIEEITIVYNYFKSLYDIIKAEEKFEDIDFNKIEQILKGKLSYDQKTNTNKYIVSKKYDPDASNDEYIFSLKNSVTKDELVFISLVSGFTTENSIIPSPTKSEIDALKKLKRAKKMF